MNHHKNSLAPSLLTFQIGAFYLKVLRECNKIFKENNVPLEMDQIPVILSLYYLNGGTQQEVCQRLQRDKASVNRTVSFLQKKGMVTTRHDLTDRRKIIIALTANGKKVAKHAGILLERLDGTVSEVLTTKEKKQFQELLVKLITSLSIQ